MAGLQDVSVRFFFVPLPRRVLRQPGVLHFHIPTRPYSKKRPFGIYSKEKFCAEIELSL